MVSARDYDGILPEAGEQLFVSTDIFLDRILFYMREGKTPVFLCDDQIAKLLREQADLAEITFCGASLPDSGERKWLFANKWHDGIDWTWMPDDPDGTIRRYLNRDYCDNNWIFLIPAEGNTQPIDIGSII